MWGHPGKKLLFMGGEFGQRHEWGHDGELEWWALEQPRHAGLKRFMSDLNRVYKSTPALHRLDFSEEGFEWVVGGDEVNSVFAFLRKAKDGSPPVLVVANMTPIPRTNYLVGVTIGGFWRPVLNSDAIEYGGSGMANEREIEVNPVRAQGRRYSMCLTLPPLSTQIFEPIASPSNA
ncbi:MAG: 1,4-alpha-glucan branching enzyme, partial [Rhizobacter sp.]|nr:1,4-alpha-glucan branching enzyme [Rhizobacter sp.]